MYVRDVELGRLSLDALGSVLGESRLERFSDTMKRAAGRLRGRTLWHINSTSEGGGVAEILQSVLGYVAALGIDVRWGVIDGSEEFFSLTKRIHNMLHGADGVSLSDDDRALYERTLRGEACDARAGDVVVLHDPQTVGLAQTLRDRGCDVLWSCHIGADQPNVAVKEAWDFLLPYALATQAQVFSRRAYVWEGLSDEQVAIIPPCIDPCAVKNKPLDEGTVRGVLDVIARRAVTIETAPCDPSGRLVVQVSRWDGLKDPIGVMRGFADHVRDAQLMLAGPAVGSVDDDPESKRVLDEVLAAREQLAEPARARVHIASLPMDDVDENAAIVNALQRRADVVVQKSKAEGFGLTVAEAMWKARPVVGSRVGGIQDQIEDGESGLLVDPDDLESFGAAVTRLLDDRALAEKIGTRARERASNEYLTDCYLGRWMDLIERVI